MIVYRYCVYVYRCYMMLRIMVLYKYRKHIEIDIVEKAKSLTVAVIFSHISQTFIRRGNIKKDFKGKI